MTSEIQWSAVSDAESWKPVKGYPRRLKKAELEALCIDLMKKLADAKAQIESYGGATAIRFKGKIILTHPEMPAHTWDGEKMERIL